MVMIAGEQFADLACLTCVHVLEGDTVKLVSRDDEEEWRFLCSQLVHESHGGRIISIEEAVSLDSRQLIWGL